MRHRGAGNSLNKAACPLFLVLALSGNVWAEKEPENKSTDEHGITATKQGHSLTTTDMPMQGGDEQPAGAQKDAQSKQNELTKYAVTDELVCGDATVIFTQDGDISSPWYLRKWKLFIQETQKELDNNIIGGYVGKWGCVTNKGENAIAIDLFSGGNCMSCEWTNIYDLKGGLIMSDYFHLQGADSKYYPCADMYFKKYLGGFSASWVEEYCKQQAKEKRFQTIKSMVKKNLAVARKIKTLTDKKMHSPKSPGN